MAEQSELFKAAPVVVEGLIGGVDNGLNGGIVLLGESTPIKLVMPVVRVRVKARRGKKGFGFRTYLNEPAIRSFFESYRPAHVFIETVQSRPGQSVIATQTTSINHGLIRGILVGLKIDYTPVAARSWQAVMFQGLPKDADIDSKDKALIICNRLWPGVEWTATARSIVNHTGLPDAALIAAWGKLRLAAGKITLDK